MACCLIGGGSNQGARREQLDRAIELLGVMPGITMRAVSRHRETRPIGGPPDQAPFLNGACLIDTELGPHDLLGVLSAVENTLHRDRTERWGPRTIDLDIVAYDDQTIADERLTVPHPHAHERAFVLAPMADLAPDLMIAGKSVREWLAQVDASGMTRL
jgi:2-amino-4-hydroxy-6-hydroxymethyldihydropteridine diphosphokinase